ncbi:MAG: transglycosylase SLT domain-containing protein [Patescibacteria group bacterium]
MRRGNAIIAIIVGVLALIFFTFAIIYYVFTEPIRMAKSIGEALFGGGGSAQAAQSAALEPVDCSGTKVPKIYLPVIKQAAKRFLGGDEAVIVALVSIESSFNAKDISGTGAVGIAQFTGSTARGTQSAGLFKGLKIITVPRANFPTVTLAEKQSFLAAYPSEGRLQPNPSIEAAAYKMGFAIKKYGGVREGYAQGYHRFANESQKADAYSAADKLMKIYEKIKTDGGCKALKDTPGLLGEDIRKLTGSK